MAEVHFDSENVHISDHAIELANLYMERSNHDQIMKNGKFDAEKAKRFEIAIRLYERDIKNFLKNSELRPTEIYDKIREKGTNVYTWFDGTPSILIITHALVNCLENKSIVYDDSSATYKMNSSKA